MKKREVCASVRNGATFGREYAEQQHFALCGGCINPRGRIAGESRVDDRHTINRAVARVARLRCVIDADFCGVTVDCERCAFVRGASKEWQILEPRSVVAGGFEANARELRRDVRRRFEVTDFARGASHHRVGRERKESRAEVGGGEGGGGVGGGGARHGGRPTGGEGEGGEGECSDGGVISHRYNLRRPVSWGESQTKPSCLAGLIGVRAKPSGFDWGQSKTKPV